MKLIIDLAADTAVSESAAKAPKFIISKMAGHKTLIVGSSVSKNFKDGVNGAKKAVGLVKKLVTLRKSLAIQVKMRDGKHSHPSQKDQIKGNIVTIKKNIAVVKKNITTANSAAIKALKVFGPGISVPYATADLVSPTKGARIKEFKGLKVKGLTGYVTTAKTSKDESIASAHAARSTRKPSHAKAVKEGKARTKAAAAKKPKDSPAVTKAKINGQKLSPAKIAKMNAEHAASKKSMAAENKEILGNLNKALGGTKLKRSDLKGAKVTTDKLGAIKITTKDGHAHKIAGSVAKKIGIKKDDIEYIMPE